MTRLDFINRRLAGPPPSTPVALLYGFVCVAAPTGLRALAAPVVTATTYGTYYPFILLASVFLGWHIAAAVAVGACIAGNFLFVDPHFTFFPSPGERFSGILFLISSAMIVAVGNTLRRSVAELHDSKKHEQHLNRELQHRVKNALAVVQGLVTQTFRGTPEAKEPLAKLQGRLRALADANEILRDGEWESCSLPDLAIRALDPFNGGGAISLIGPECSLPEEACVPLVLALHELATNAVKYGALSSDQGVVELRWEADTDDCLLMSWTERLGPPVDPPVRTGLGSKLLRPGRGLASVEVYYNAEGVSARIVAKGLRAVSLESRTNLAPPAAMHAIDDPSRDIRKVWCPQWVESGRGRFGWKAAVDESTGKTGMTHVVAERHNQTAAKRVINRLTPSNVSFNEIGSRLALIGTAETAGDPEAPGSARQGAVMHFPKAAITLLLSTALIGAKAPPTPPGTTDPQVGYVKILNNGARELWVAREDGTGAVRLAATGVKSWMFFGLGPKSQGLLAYAIPGQLHLLHFVQGSSGVKTDTDTVIVNNATNFAGAPAVSPTGSHIAWVGTIAGGAYGIHVYSLATHSIINEVTSSALLSGYVDFSADGSKLIYSETITPGDTLTVGFKSVPVTGGVPTDLGIQGKYGTFRVGPGDEIVTDTGGDPKGSLWLFPSGATSPTPLTTNGYMPSPRCDSGSVIFARIESSGGTSIRKYEIATGLTTTFSTTGIAPDYFPDC